MNQPRSVGRISRPDQRSASGNPTSNASPRPTLGFGVPATSDPHHFKVIIPRSNTGRVQISEYLGLQATTDEHSVIDRVLLDRPRWEAIRSEAQRAFNARLVAHGPVNTLVPGSILQETNADYHVLGSVAEDVRIEFS